MAGVTRRLRRAHHEDTKHTKQKQPTKRTKKTATETQRHRADGGRTPPRSGGSRSRDANPRHPRNPRMTLSVSQCLRGPSSHGLREGVAQTVEEPVSGQEQ